MSNRYSMLIQWSDADQTFVVSFPDFPSAHTHGETYSIAAENGRQALELLIEALSANNEPLPEPRQIILAVG
jgi:predicted RNase H-like HicB family nuclease